MAQRELTLFNYYRRYRWKAADFEILENSLRDNANGLAEGFGGQSVLVGMDFEGVTGMNVGIEAGIACGPSGDLLVTDEVTEVELIAPTGANTVKHYIVARPTITQEELIARPTSPFENVPLHEVRSCEIVAVAGTPAVSSSYPSVEANDVILMGVEIPAGASSVLASYLNLRVRDRLGKNTDLGALSPYEAIVGTSNPLHTHRTLKQAMDDAGVLAGSRVLVCDDETVNAVISVAKEDLVIEFKPGVTFTKGSAATGFNISAQNVVLERPRMAGFNGGSDVAIAFAAGGEYGAVMHARFDDCTNEVDDSLTTSGVHNLGSHTEA